ncbi:unnamed protein product [Musa textilis]
MAAMAFPSTSLMASTPRLLRKPSSLASSSSLFLVSGGGRVALGPVLRRQHGSGALGCRCLFGLGVPELVVIAGVAALVFGPKKLPEIGRSFGKTVKSFQQVRLVRVSSILYFCSCTCYSSVARFHQIIVHARIACIEYIAFDVSVICHTKHPIFNFCTGRKRI